MMTDELTPGFTMTGFAGLVFRSGSPVIFKHVMMDTTKDLTRECTLRTEKDFSHFRMTRLDCLKLPNKRLTLCRINP
jgi:hypothetical protein